MRRRHGLSQKRRILLTLQRQQRTGVPSTALVTGEFDGMGPVLNYAARIEELRREGVDIETRREPRRLVGAFRPGYHSSWLASLTDE